MVVRHVIIYEHNYYLGDGHGRSTEIFIANNLQRR